LIDNLSPRTRKRLENGTLSHDEMKALGLDVDEYDGELANDGEEYGIEDDGEDAEAD
jgi:hypothetical protein